MAEFRHNPETGQVYTYDGPAGQWREMGALEAEVAQSGTTGQVAAGIAGLSPLSLLTEGGQALQSAQPGAFMAGEAVTLGLGGGLGGAAKGLNGSTMTQRIMANYTKEKAARSAQAGASTLRTESGMLKGLQDVAPEALRGAARTVESAPGLSLLTGMRGMHNRGLAGKSLGRWLGMSDDLVARSKGKLTDDVMEEALSETDDMYRSISSALDDTITPAQFDGMVDDAVKRKVLIKDLGEDWKAMDMDMGDKIIALRSELRAQARGNIETTAKQQTDKAIQNIQGIIDDALKGTDAEGISKVADTRYSRWMALKNSQAIETGTGNVRRASLDQVLRKRDPRMMLGKRDGMDDETANLVQSMKDWKSVGDPLPSSGTSERALAMSLLGSAVGVNIF